FHVDALSAVLAHRPSLARFSGGAARSAVWAGLVADALAMPVETVAVEELGALGAAMLAALAVGRFAGPAEAVAAMVHVARRFEPEPGRARVMERKFARQRRVVEALAPAWTAFGQRI